MQRTRITYILVFAFIAVKLFSQTPNFNNSWINHSLYYYKIKIANDSLYKVDSLMLAKAGVPALNPNHLHFYQKGVELYVYISGAADSVFNKNDYILFYAERNKGKDDSLLYANGAFLTNPYYSVINDTSAVFFTYDNSSLGKRLTLNTDTNYSAYNPSPYYLKQVYSTRYDYSFGPYNIVNQNDPRYVLGEGYFSSLIDVDSSYGGCYGATNNFSYGFNTSSAYTVGSAPLPYATVCFSGANDIGSVNPDHIVQISHAGIGTTTLGTYSVSGYNSGRYTYFLNPANFTSSTTSINVSNLPNPLTSIDNLLNVNYVSVVYPQQFNMLGQTQEKIYLPDANAPQTKSELVISGFTNKSSQPILIDTSNRLISFMPATLTPSTFTVLVPNTGKNKFCFLSSLAAADTALKITPVNGTGTFVNYPLLDSAFVIVSHPKLINLPSTGVSQYQAFRSSVAGGNYHVIVASIEDLYDQFAYGVERNPLAIKNFCGYLINKASAGSVRPPSNLFLIGKGVHAWECIPVQCPYVTAAVAAAECLVPSFGNPSSDILFTQGLPGSSYYPEPAIPTGRICAQTDADVHNYLSKAQLYVAQDPDSLWHKRAIHFIGGDTPGDQQTFNSYMNVCKQIYQNPFIGGNVFSFYKTTTTPISINTNDSVALLINQGVSLMTFFGHGSQTGFDQNIDLPSAYNNSPKFPFIVANSCFTGDIFASNQITNSEEWILAPGNKGSIGYIATTAEGVANDLTLYTAELYKQFSYKNYGMPYAYCVKEDINYLMNPAINSTLYNDTLLQETCLEMTMEGDPAIKPNTVQKPDYMLTNADVIFNTSTYPDSIGIKIVMTNLGKAINTNFNVKVVRQFPNGVDSVYIKSTKAPLYKDTLSFFIFKNYNIAVGNNCFTIDLNYLNAVPEINSANNTTTPCIPLFIPGSDINPVWPYKYAIVPDIHNVTLEASTANPLAPSTKYVFQLDTSASFSSPVLINQNVTAPGGVVSLPIRLTLNKDSVVYFWRVAKDTTLPNWKQSSFQVINGKQGWEQAHFRQFNNNTYQYVQYDSAHWRFNFANNVRTILVKDKVTESNFDFTEVQFYMDNGQARIWSCGVGGWNIAIFDTISGNPIPSYSVSIAQTYIPGDSHTLPAWNGNAGNCICDDYSNKVTYDFGLNNSCLNAFNGQGNSDINWARKMTTFIAGIPNRVPVLAYTTNGYYGGSSYSTLPSAALKTALYSIGSNKIDSLRDTTSLIIFGRKGMSPGRAHEVLSHTANQLITLTDTLETRFNNGYIASEIIGPARYSDTTWKSLHWHYCLPVTIPGSVPTVATDSIVIQVIGIDSNGVKTQLANFTRDSLDVLDLSHYTNQIPHKFFPYLQLIAYEKDNHVHRPPQLKRWQVIYDPAPECALYPTGGYSVANTTIAEGQTYQVVMPIKNIGAVPFPDSLVVNYYVEDANRVTHNFSQTKPKGFAPGAVMPITFTVNTIGLGGSNIFGIDVNTPGKPKYQNEQYHFNNIAQIGFNVTKDKINPVLDVTFDGTHILNGDIVSAKPDILISLKDENKFLALNDTGNFAVYTTTANSSVQKRLYFNNPQLQFTAAVLPNNSCKINYKPILTQDGKYSLDVKATDRSSNVSGRVDYKIQYEVINKPMITEVLNYPNPFSTSTKFVFTITGSEIPQTLKIQIMTITGKVVKEISREELGYLHIGRNISEYAWDGTDQYGGKLANGVYFYHVVTRLSGNEVNHMSTSADEFFKKGLGKMVIMR